MNKKFKPMSQKQKNEIYGGWAWMVALFPFVMQSLLSTVASVKMLFADNGSVKYNGMQSTWSQNKQAAGKSGNTKEYYYDI